MRNFKFFSRRVRIVSLGLFLLVGLFCKVPSTPVSLFYASLATSVEFFDDRWTHYVTVQNGGSSLSDLSIEGKPPSIYDQPCRSLKDVKLLTRDTSVAQERYALLSWKKLQGLWTNDGPVRTSELVPDRGSLAIECGGGSPYRGSVTIICGGRSFSIPSEQVTYHPFAVKSGPSIYPNRR